MVAKPLTGTKWLKKKRKKKKQDDIKKSAKKIHWGKTVFSTNDVRTAECPYAKKLKLDPFLIPYTKKIN